MNELTMNIPTAAAARKALEQGQYEAANNQAREVERLIKEAIGKGQNRANGDGYIEQSVKTQLEALGYKIENGNHRNEEYWSVSW